MTPEQFIAKWRASELSERAAAQSHFNDLCALLDVPAPAEADSRGADYTFEKSVTKPGGRKGRADVWKRGCFAWEYKGHARNLTQAYSQLKEYADALDNPPLLIVSDMKEIRIHTNWTNTVAEIIVIDIADLTSVEARRKLVWAFTDPEKLKPTRGRNEVTAEAAERIGALAAKLSRKYDPRRVAHFLNKLVFSMFAEDIGLLPSRLFAELIEESVKDANEFVPLLTSLFGAMRTEGGRFGKHRIHWFNGGLFDDDDVLPLGSLEIRDLAAAARLDWGHIEPAIFGTLFEKGLDPEKRKEMAGLFDTGANGKESGAKKGARAPKRAHGIDDRGVGIHYTDPSTIMKIVEPVVLRPLEAEWSALKTAMAELAAKAKRATTDSQRTRLIDERRKFYWDFRQRLGALRVLDPACGSGNFLYLSLRHLKDFDARVVDEARALGGLPGDKQRVGPEAVKGIEINPYAAELARVTIWIGELQWQMEKGCKIDRRPILGTLKAIECRDALLNDDGSETEWPAADCIVGNPPFLGGKRLISALGEDYVARIFDAYDGRVPREADLVCYWFEKARGALEAGSTKYAGLVATNSIRGGANRRVLQRIKDDGFVIYEAWSDEPWVIEGAAVRVSLVAIATPGDAPAKTHLNGSIVGEIFTDLTAGRAASAIDVTTAKQLPENSGIAFMATTKGGAFDVKESLAHRWIGMPLNPNGRPNSDVVRPWANGMDITRRPANKWIVDFGTDMSAAEAALYEAPFAYVQQKVRPERNKNRREAYRKYWWRFVEPRPRMRQALAGLTRFIGTPTVAKHRLFVWMPSGLCPDHQLIAIARNDDTTFGILHSRFHEIWALRLGTSLEDRPRYTPSTTFETFPFPAGLTPDIPAKDYANDPRAKRIAEAVRRLNELRENWLNPPDLVKREPEVVPGFPDRILPRTDKAAAELKKRTLTNLYNQRPAWLANAHRELDEAVAAAYGWPAGLSDDDILARLLMLNQKRAGAEPARRDTAPPAQGKTG